VNRRHTRSFGATTAGLAAALVISATGCAYVERINLTSSGAPGDADVVGSASISADGRFVAFAQGGAPLVAGVPDSALTHVYVRDLLDGTTEIVDVSDSGIAGTGHALAPSISADGRFVAFESEADDLVAGDTNVASDVFVRDRAAGTTSRVSIAADGSEGNDSSNEPSISADGNKVAFSSYADNLVLDDWNGSGDIFVRDRNAATTVRASVMSNGDEGDLCEDSYEPSISGDGNVVAFTTYESFILGDTNDEEDVYVHEMMTAKTKIISTRMSNVSPDGGFGPPDVSGDGRYVAFNSYGPLDGGTTPLALEVFVRDRSAATTERISVAAGGALSNGISSDPTISADGRYVAFRSAASNLVAGDTNADDDVFVRDRTAAATTLVSRDVLLGQLGGTTYGGTISGDGKMIAFTTPAPVTDKSGATIDDGKVDVYARYLRAPTITSVNPPAVPRGTTTAVTITGRGFTVGATLPMSDGIVARRIVVVGSTRITARLKVPAGLHRGLTPLRVRIPGPSWNTENGAMAECKTCLRVTR